jgi:AraC-like DNA-binding protein
VNFYLPRKTLDAIADDADARRISDLKFTPGVGVMDPILGELTRLLLPAFDYPDRVSQLFADHISLALGAHIAQTYGGMRSVAELVRGGLATWQERRAKELMSANLHRDVSTAAIAAECSLSAGHFARAFRRSTGLSPHQWLLQRRIDEAHGLLRRPQAFACRDRTRLRLCRSKPLHESLYASVWHHPWRLATTAGNYSEVLKECNRALCSRGACSIRIELTKDVSFLQERAPRTA